MLHHEASGVSDNCLIHFQHCESSLIAELCISMGALRNCVMWDYVLEQPVIFPEMLRNLEIPTRRKLASDRCVL